MEVVRSEKVSVFIAVEPDAGVVRAGADHSRGKQLDNDIDWTIGRENVLLLSVV